jgi:hypothetical protein
MSESEKPTEYTVHEGDHLSRVSAAQGFRSYAPLWNAPENQALRTRRHNPHILAVGDEVHIPPVAFQEVDRPTERRHRFRAELHPLSLRLEFKTWDGKPVTEKPASVTLDGKEVAFEPAGDGGIALPVAPVSDRCVVKFSDRELPLRIGFLQPVDTLPGYRARLDNLGYDPGDSGDPNDVQLRSAVEEFQCDQGLAVDGKCGPDTQRRLAAVHGC